MRSDRNKALKLRLQGRSYNEIVDLLGVPKSTLSGWFTGLELSSFARERIANRVYSKSVGGLIKRNRLQSKLAEERASKTQTNAKKDIGKLLRRDLFLIGVALYWAKGYKRPKLEKGKVKTHHSVSLTNSDPGLIKLFLRFLREICNVPEDRITADLRIYQHQNGNYLLDFWSKMTEIPYNNFRKMYYGTSISSQHKRPFNILPYGTIQVRVNSTELYHRIMGWIRGMIEN